MSEEYIYENRNLERFEAYGPEIDQLVCRLQSILTDFGNSPSGDPTVILHFLREAHGKMMYLKHL